MLTIAPMMTLQNTFIIVPKFMTIYMSIDRFIYPKSYLTICHQNFKVFLIYLDPTSRPGKIKPRLLSEEELRSIGVQQSTGWINFGIHNPEPHILLFRRKHNGNREISK
eukprot:NODE_134_length_16603_cov_0.784052.p16 type:complete len:109 gc:universal NODE_134_length_16603_cov_0.784052:14113-14439(+)